MTMIAYHFKIYELSLLFQISTHHKSRMVDKKIQHIKKSVISHNINSQLSFIPHSLKMER